MMPGLRVELQTNAEYQRLTVHFARTLERRGSKLAKSYSAFTNTHLIALQHLTERPEEFSVLRKTLAIQDCHTARQGYQEYNYRRLTCLDSQHPEKRPI